jgi:hypothetical protein
VVAKEAAKHKGKNLSRQKDIITHPDERKGKNAIDLEVHELACGTQ